LDRYQSILDQMFSVDTKKCLIVNADETLLYVTDKSLNVERVKARGRSGGVDDGRPYCAGSLTTFVGADGTVWLALFVLKGSSYVPVPTVPRDRKASKQPLKTLFRCSPSGYVTKEIWKEVLETLVGLKIMDMVLSKSCCCWTICRCIRTKKILTFY